MPKNMTSSAEGIEWDLTDFYDSLEDPRIDKDIEEALKRADDFGEKYRGKVEERELTPAELDEAMKEYEAIYELMGKVGSYAVLAYSVDTQDADRGALYARAQQKSSEMKNKLIFFELEWQNLEDEDAEEYLEAGELDKYSSLLRHWRKYTPYMLSEKEEQLVESLQNTGKKAFVRLFDETLGDIEVPVEKDGEEKKMVLDQALSLLYEEDRELRKEATRGVTEALKSKKKLLSFIFNNIVLNHDTIGKFRNYPHPMTPRNLDNRVDKETVDALIEACMNNVDMVHRFYDIKKDILGYDKLYDHDRYNPLPGAQSEITFEESKEKVLDAYERFSPKMKEIAEKFFEESWIDAQLKAGKRGGAFSASTVPSVHPYILLNFTDKPRDAMTMAHELGHGIHQYLAREQGYLQQSTPLTTAEMASVFGEMLLFDKMLKEEEDPKAKLALIGNKLQGEYATVFRQIVMTRFELALHEARVKEGELKPERINELWLEANREQFGDSVELSDDYGWWWSYVLHFVHYPFYCYAYAFGDLLVLALYGLYQEQGDEFAPKYVKLLSKGGSEDPKDLLSEIGVDITDPEFWQKGLSVLREHLEIMEDLLEAST